MRSISAVRAAYEAGTTTPAEVVDRLLEASPTAGRWRAFRAVDVDDVRRQADASATRLAEGRAAGPLEGIPVAVKDMYAVRGHRTHSGTRDLVHHGDEDALLVTRLRDAGAIIVGKAHCTELGLAPTGLNTVFGAPVNPAAPDRIPGGSSSGSGVAVSAGLTPLAIGSDGGGSIRIPAACTGVFGIKPTFGRVPTTGGAPIGWWSLDHAGPLATSAQDLATGLAVLTGADVDMVGDPVTYGVDWAWWGQPDPSLDGICRAIAAELDPEHVTVDHIGLASVAGKVTALSELAAGVWDAWQDRPDRFSADLQVALSGHEAVSGADYVRAQQVRRALADAFEEVFRRVDVLVVPTTATPPPLLPSAQDQAGGVVDIDMIDAMTAYTFPANLCGLPAASVPVGTTPAGAPVGLQLIGRHGDDATVLRAAASLEHAGLASSVIPRDHVDLLGGLHPEHPAPTTPDHRST